MIIPDLRPMTKDDIEGVAVLEAACFSVPWSAKTVTELVTSPYDETWVLEMPESLSADSSRSSENISIAGYITFRILDDPLELMRIAVAPACRGRGYSKILMDRMTVSAAESGIKNITLEVRASNTAAVSLYALYGFREETLRKGYYTDPDEDAVIMWKRG